MMKETHFGTVAEEDVGGLTAEEDRLFTAISFGKLHRVTSLLPDLRSTEIRDDFGSTPLLHTARNAHSEHVNFLVKLLLHRGSDVNAQDDVGMTSLMRLIQRGSSVVDAMRTLMRCKHCDPNVMDKEGNTALIYAAKFGNVEALTILLFPPPKSSAKRAEVNARNREGLAALDVAIMEKQAACCEMLSRDGKADAREVKDAETFNTLLVSAQCHARPS
ncbi:hypothetical protein ACOMHN_025632 [Nucella lapillus]